MTDLERVAAAIETAFYAAVDSGTNTERFVPIARAAIAAMPTIERLSAERMRKDEALRAADKRLCDLTPRCQPDGPNTLAEAAEIEETGAVVMQIRAALSNTAENG